MLPFWKRAFFGKEFKVARLGLFPNDTTMYYVAVCFGSVWALREMLELALQR
jgi:spore maturation protein SpmB